MGEIADAMVNGLFCQYCGEFLDGEEPGYPRSCSGCEPKQEQKQDKDKDKK